MVVPSPTLSAEPRVIDKKQVRAELKHRRTQHVAAIPESQRALLFRRPPAPVVAMVPEGAIIGVFHEMPGEVPASKGWARSIAKAPNGAR